MRRAALIGLGMAGGLAASTLGDLQARASSPHDALPGIAPPPRLPSRQDHLRRLSQATPAAPFDVLIIGGGATGTGCALDAVTRGLSTAMVEREDFAAGTSSRSTKLVHGGVRYLEKAFKNLDYGQLKLVFEALHERKTILDIAPHLATALPIMTVRRGWSGGGGEEAGAEIICCRLFCRTSDSFIVFPCLSVSRFLNSCQELMFLVLHLPPSMVQPCYSWWEVPYYWAGLKAYDLVAGARALSWSHYLSPGKAKASFPTLCNERKGDGKHLKGTVSLRPASSFGRAGRGEEGERKERENLRNLIMYPPSPNPSHLSTPY